MPALACLALALPSVAAQPASPPLGRRIAALVEASEGARSAFWGIRVVDAGTGRALYELNANRFFVPASNMKLFSTALALERLGPEYHFRTLVTGARPVDGVIRGGLTLIGAGDPTLSGRVYPYRKGARENDPLAAVGALADQIRARGVREVDGDIAGDDTVYPWEPYPAGWGVDDVIWSYGAPVSALTVNDNTVTLRVLPGGRAGDPARLSLRPSLEYYVLDNRVSTQAGRRKIEVDRIGRQLVLRGTIPPGDSGHSLALSIDDPAAYAAAALRQALVDRGIVVRGSPAARHRPSPPPQGEVLAERVSPPLAEILQVIDKVSQNLHAELILREVGRTRKGDGSREAAFADLREFLGECGIDPKEANFEDASGMSVMSLVTPAAVTKLLARMLKSRHADAWEGLLPEGGEDGTLSNRFDGNPAARRIRAKTGTLSHVAALAGYAETKSGRRRVFSIFVNNFNCPGSEIRRVIDRIGLLLVE